MHWFVAITLCLVIVVDIDCHFKCDVEAEQSSLLKALQKVNSYKVQFLLKLLKPDILLIEKHNAYMIYQ